MAQSQFDFSVELKRQLQRKILLLIIVFLVVFTVINLLFSFIIFPVSVVSESMAPEYSSGSRVFVAVTNGEKPLFWQKQDILRGSVVYLNPDFSEYKGWLPELGKMFGNFFLFQNYNTILEGGISANADTLRRVVGMPGDTIYMKNYELYVKPAGESHFLTESEMAQITYETSIEGSTAHDGRIGVPQEMDEIVLGDNEYFLLADNRVFSIDSRFYGPVKASQIKGVAVWRFFPFN